MTKKVKIRVFCTNEKCTTCVLPLFCFSSTLLCRSVIESKTKERLQLSHISRMHGEIHVCVGLLLGSHNVRVHTQLECEIEKEGNRILRTESEC